MIDVALSLEASGWKGTMHAVSRHGLLPSTHRAPLRQTGHAPSPRHFLEPGRSASLTEHVRRIRAEIDRTTEQGGDWREVIDSLRPVTVSLWLTLTASERRRFLRHLRPYWDAARHRAPCRAAERVTGLMSEGRLVIHPGHIVGLRAGAGEVLVEIRPRGSSLVRKLRVARVVNCTGPQCDYGRIEQPLVRGLRSAGLLVADGLRLGIRTAPDGALLDARGTASRTLFTLGPPRRGDLWETTAMPEIRTQAADLAVTLLGS